MRLAAYGAASLLLLCAGGGALLLLREDATGGRSPASPGIGLERNGRTQARPGALLPERAETREVVTLDDARVTFVVRGTSGALIEDALLSLLTEEGKAELARTNGAGEARVPRATLSGGGELMAQAPSYAVAFLNVAELEGDTVEITLAHGGSVSGFVRALDQSCVGPGVRVTAVPQELFRALDRTRNQELRCHYARSTLTDSDGGFLIDGLREGALYRLDAVRAGAAVRVGDERARVFATASGVILTLHEIYGALLRYSCADEAHMARFFRPKELRTSGPAHLQRNVDWTRSLGLRLFGLLPPPDCSHCDVLYYTLMEPTDHGQRSIRCEGSIPGFQVFRTEIEVLPLRDGALPEYDVELVADAEGAGTVLLELVGAGAPLASQMGVASALHLIRDSDGRKLSYGARWRDGAVTAVSDVPAGRYRWSLAVETGWIRVSGTAGAGDAEPPGAPFSLGDGEVVRLEVPMPEDIAYIELECHAADGPVTSYVMLADGPFYTAGGTAAWIRGVVCREFPQVIGPLPAGRYDLQVVEPRPLPEGAVSIELRPGEIHQALFVLP